MATLLVGVLNVAITFLDLLLFPINYFIYKPPWKNSKQPTESYPHELIFSKDCTEVCYKPALPEPICLNQELMVNESLNTMDKVFDFMVKNYAKQSCLGHRKIIGTRKHLTEDGKVLNKIIFENK